MGTVNPKKRITLKNNTKYFEPLKDKVRVSFGSPSSYQNRNIKIEGYETRLYWQFKFCEDNDGQVFYYTLTYNEAAMPRHYGINCFDYEDLRYLLTGGFRKILLRKYGTIFKYFVGAELGDGKGSRGMHNNPHYHILFFLQPDPDKKYPYVKISSIDFRHYVRKYWQGFDQSVDGYRSFKKALFGIAKEGKNNGLVYDFRACCYCAKYVCKDVALKQNEERVERSVRLSFNNDREAKDNLYLSFFHKVVYDKFNVPLDWCHSTWLYDDKQLIVHLLPGLYDSFFDIFGEIPDSVLNFPSYVKDICSKYDLWNDFHKYKEEYLEDKIRLAVNEYRNRYCNKCRISQGVGDYALDFVSDKLSPTIQVPSKNGFKSRPLSQYYYRKLFTDVVRPLKNQASMEKPVSLSPIRILNADGVAYKLNKLKGSIFNLSSKVSSDFSLILNDSELFDKMKSSDVNTDVFLSFDELHSLYNSLSNEKISVFDSYAVYKLVYENRFFSPDTVAGGCFSDYLCLDYFGDYARFLVPSFYSVSRSDLRLDTFLESGCEGLLPYSEHPAFRRFVRLYDVFDLCADYFFVFTDNQKQKDALDIQRVKRFHDSLALRSFYSNFV